MDRPHASVGDVYAAIPLAAPIALMSLALAVEGRTDREAILRVGQALKALLARELVQEVAPDTYARGGERRAGLPAALRDVWVHVPEEKCIALGDLALLVFDRDDAPTRNRLAVRIDRLLSLGRVERSGRGEYRRKKAEGVRASAAMQEVATAEALILAHLPGSVVELVKALDGRITPRRRREVLDGLELLKARGLVSEALGVWSRAGALVHLAGRVVVPSDAQAKALAVLPVFNGVGSAALPADLDAVGLKDAGLVQEKEGRWNRVFEVWLEGMDDWTQERRTWLEMAACADDEAELAQMMGGAVERARAVWVARCHRAQCTP